MYTFAAIFLHAFSVACNFNLTLLDAGTREKRVAAMSFLLFMLDNDRVRGGARARLLGPLSLSSL